MSAERRRLTDSEFLERLFDEIGDLIIHASDEEIMEDARLEGRDIEKEASETKAVLLRAMEQWKAKQGGVE